MTLDWDYEGSTTVDPYSYDLLTMSQPLDISGDVRIFCSLGCSLTKCTSCGDSIVGARIRKKHHDSIGSHFQNNNTLPSHPEDA